MSLSGSPSRCCIHLHPRGQGSLNKRVALLPCTGISRELFCLERSKCHIQRTPFLKCATDASYGGAKHDSPAVFPRINIKDPYKRLGISSEASEDEIQGSTYSKRI